MRRACLCAMTLTLMLLQGAAQQPAGLTDSATPIEDIKVRKDFKVELLYSVPRDRQGSWVNLTVDPRGRLITSDQYGMLYRITPPPIGTSAGAKVEPLAVNIGRAH